MREVCYFIVVMKRILLEGVGGNLGREKWEVKRKCLDSSVLKRFFFNCLILFCCSFFGLKIVILFLWDIGL